MPTNVKEVFRTTVLPMSKSEQLELATLILEKVTQKPRRAGADTTKFFGMFDSGDPDSADNERIDADLACAYMDDHEDED